MENKSRQILICNIISLIFFLIIYYETGSYFELYEVFNNYVVHTASFHDGYLKPISNEVFLIRQLYMFIQQKLPNIPINEIAHIANVYAGLFTLTLTIYNVIRHKTLKWIAIIILYLLFAENITIINTSRIAFICGVASLGFMLTDFKCKKILFYLLAILSVFNRVEVGIVIFTLGSLIFLLDSSMRKMSLHTSIVVFIGVICMMTFKLYNAKFCPYVDTFSKVERKFIHHKNFNFSISDIDDILYGRETDTIKLKNFANSLFIMDEPTIRYQDVPKILKQKTYIDFVTNDTYNFLSFYIQSLLSLANNYIKYIFIILASLIIMILKLSNSIRQKKNIFQHIIIISAFFFIPIIISMNVTISERFISPYICCLFIISLIYFLKSTTITNRNKFIGLSLVIVSLFINFKSLKNTDIAEYAKRDKTSKVILEDFHKEYISGNNPMFLYIFSTMLLPGKLFSYPNKLYSEFRFMSLSVIDQTEYFKNINKKIYGADYKSLATRIKYMKENSKYVYAYPLEISFLENYMHKIHGIEIKFNLSDQFEEIQAFNSIKIHKYEVVKH